eukprot:COSAG06_NODE_6495_length_2909_cov_3.721708_2_plen_868_part_01
MAVVWWVLAASCSLEALASHRGAAAAAVSTHGPGVVESGRRRAQGAARDQPLCAELEQRGEQAVLCSTSVGREMCPSTCGEAGTPPPPPPPPPPPASAHACNQLASRGMCSSPDVASVCPGPCETSNDTATIISGTSTRADGAAVFQASCLVFLKLEGGCAHDLSQEDSALEPGTRVSDVCPSDCSGHGKCAASAMDISFLGSVDDSSGFGATMELHGGGACVDGGGLTFDGSSWATIVPGYDYGNGAAFVISFWILLATEGVWEPHRGFSFRSLYDHPPRSQSSVAGGILVSVSRTQWLDSWNMRASIAGTFAHFELDLLRGAAPKWTHIAIKVEQTQFQVYEDGARIKDTQGRVAVPRNYIGTMELASELVLGGLHSYASGTSPSNFFRGSIAMLQLYAAGAASELDVQCVYDGGKELVQNQRMAQDTPSECRTSISTGCTNQNADNFDETLPADAIDDGSCEFTQHEAVTGEHGAIHVTDDWQRVDLSRSYSNPVVLCGVVTRDSTTEAVVRVRSVTINPQTGEWYFEISAEQKSCHSANPPPTSERVDFIVVEAGVSAEGWQAGLTRVHSADWHRVSFLQEVHGSGQQVVISQSQTYDNRTQFVSTRHFMPAPEEEEPNFVVVDLEMNWLDAQHFCRTHYHDVASIHSATENALVGSLLVDQGLSGGFIGINNHNAEGTFKWTDGSPADFVAWSRGEPNDWGNGRAYGGSEGIGRFMSGTNLWNDIAADTQDPVICKAHYNATHQQRHLAFFLKLQGEGIWCQDGQFFAEYFDNLDLSGTPHATQCEIDVPSWHWHSISHEGDAVPGVPPILVGTIRNLAPELFSVRWTARMNMDQSDEYVFSSRANKGSRIIIDSATILDSWE